MADQKKPAARKASPFGTSNQTAAFSPPRASFGSAAAGKTPGAASTASSTSLGGAAEFDNNRSSVKRGQKS